MATLAQWQPLKMLIRLVARAQDDGADVRWTDSQGEQSQITSGVDDGRFDRYGKSITGRNNKDQFSNNFSLYGLTSAHTVSWPTFRHCKEQHPSTIVQPTQYSFSNRRTIIQVRDHREATRQQRRYDTIVTEEKEQGNSVTEQNDGYKNTKKFQTIP